MDDTIPQNRPQDNPTPKKRGGRPRKTNWVCTKCGEADRDKFYFNSRGYLRSTCKDCDKKYSINWHNEHRERVKTRVSEWNKKHPHYDRQRDYGVSPEEYESMLSAQGGRCLICNRLPAEGRTLHVDHCHSTGRVRGLLCMNCNHGLGKFQDNSDLLRKAALYLEQ